MKRYHFNKKQIFSIRKFKFGASSALIGAFLIGGPVVAANEGDAQAAAAVSVVAPSGVSEGEAATSSQADTATPPVAETPAETEAQASQETPASEPASESTPASAETPATTEAPPATSPEAEAKTAKVTPVAGALATFSWQEVPAASQLLSNSSELQAAGATMSYVKVPIYGMKTADVVVSYPDGSSELVTVPIKVTANAVRRPDGTRVTKKDPKPSSETKPETTTVGSEKTTAPAAETSPKVEQLGGGTQTGDLLTVNRTYQSVNESSAIRAITVGLPTQVVQESTTEQGQKNVSTTKTKLDFSYSLEHDPSKIYTGLPSGLTFDPTSQRISGSVLTAGQYSIYLKATQQQIVQQFDTTGMLIGESLVTLATDTKAIDLDINALSSTKQVSFEDSGIRPISVAGGVLADAVAFTHTKKANNQVTVVSGLPEGLTFNRTTGRIEGRPTAAGQYDIIAQAITGSNNMVTQASLYVVPASNQLTDLILRVGAKAAPVATGTSGFKSIKAQQAEILVDGQPVVFFTNTNADNNATVIGETSEGKEKSSTAIGHNAKALESNATALGKDARVAEGATNGFAGGKDAYVSGTNGIAIGNGDLRGRAGSNTDRRVQATGDNSIALGHSTRANGDSSTAIGKETHALAIDAVALGTGAISGSQAQVDIYNKAYQQYQKDNNISNIDWLTPQQKNELADLKKNGTEQSEIDAAKYQMMADNITKTKAFANEAVENAGGWMYTTVAIGKTAHATENNATAIGTNANASGEDSIAFGRATQATNNSSVAIGLSANSTGRASVALGKDAKAQGENTIAIGLNATTGENFKGATAIGDQTQANGTEALAIGAATEASGTQSTAIGTANFALTQGTVVGNNSAAGTNAAAYGHLAEAAGRRSVAIGAEVTSVGDASIAMGSNTSAIGNYAVSLGSQSNARAVGAVSVGAFNNITATNGTAVGTGNQLKTEKSYVLGGNVTTTVANSVYLGAESAAVAKGDSTAGMEKAGDANVNGLVYGGFAGNADKTAGVVTVGSVGAERRIQNMAAGEISESSTDAINGSQLYAVASKLGWNIIADKTENGTNSGIVENQFISPNETIKLIAGNGVNVEQNGNDFVFSVKYDKSIFTLNDNGELTFIQKPTIKLTETDEFTTIDVTNMDGNKETATIKNGKDGKDGAQGERGEKGADGKDGQDGVSPTVTVTNNNDGTHTVRVVNPDGTVTETIVRDGVDGVNGKDGVSPTVTVTNNNDGTHTVKVINPDGTVSEFIVKDGKDGVDGKNGKDGKDCGCDPKTVPTPVPHSETNNKKTPGSNAQQTVGSKEATDSTSNSGNTLPETGSKENDALSILSGLIFLVVAGALVAKRKK